MGIHSEVEYATSTGAGVEMRSVTGVAVFTGMIGVTFFGIFMTPEFYVLMHRVAGNRALIEHSRRRGGGRACPAGAGHLGKPEFGALTVRQAADWRRLASSCAKAARCLDQYAQAALAKRILRV